LKNARYSSVTAYTTQPSGAARPGLIAAESRRPHLRAGVGVPCAKRVVAPRAEEQPRRGDDNTVDQLRVVAKTDAPLDRRHVEVVLHDWPILVDVLRAAWSAAWSRARSWFALVLIAVGIVGTFVIVPNELLVAVPVAVTDGGSPLGDDHEIGADLRFL
jgi:hypothetical protein